MNAWFNFNTGSYAWQTSGSASNKLQERVSYDANGNITKYLRKGYSPINMDSLTYKYYPKSNKLLRVVDSVSVSTYADIDVDDQDSLNYEYDLTGNLVKDSIEGISLITWNLMGKVDSIARYSASSRPELKFLYDAMGNRVGKVVYDGADVTKTWYIRDAQGNIMATYEEQNDTLTWTEQHIYGSSRLGYWQPDSKMYPKPTPPATDTFRYVVRAGDKLYEISNHLGNVLASINDRKIPQETGTPNGIADYYLADIATVQDYYPFGMVMPGRNWQAGSASGYGFGFNRKLKDDEIMGSSNSYDLGARIYDSRLARFLSCDPYAFSYAWQSFYAYFKNNPILTVDIKGMGGPDIVYGKNANSNAVAESSKNIIIDIAKDAGVESLTITSTLRTADDQARAMYNNLENKGTASHYKLYGSTGDKVIDVYSSMSKTDASGEEIKQSMSDKITEIGPAKISNHCGDPTKLTVVDISPSSIPSDKREAFIAAVEKAKAEGKVTKFLHPGNSNDPAYHIEIPVLQVSDNNSTQTSVNEAGNNYKLIELNFVQPVVSVDNTYQVLPSKVSLFDTMVDYETELDYLK